MGVEKVCIYPCGGIGLIVSCVARLAAYISEEELIHPSGKIAILSPSSLLRGLEEDRRMVEECPTVVIDGCAHQCGSNFLLLLGIKPIARIYTPEIMLETHLEPGRTRKELEESGKLLAREVARQATTIARGLLETPDYPYLRQTIRPNPDPLFDYSVDVEKELGYVSVAPGIYRPAMMPPFPFRL